MPINACKSFLLLPLTILNQQALWQMNNWWIQWHTIQLLPFYVNVIPKNPTHRIHSVPIPLRFLDQGRIDTNVLLSRLPNLRKISLQNLWPLGSLAIRSHCRWNIETRSKSLEESSILPYKQSTNVNSKPYSHKKPWHSTWECLVVLAIPLQTNSLVLYLMMVPLTAL